MVNALLTCRKILIKTRELMVHFYSAVRHDRVFYTHPFIIFTLLSKVLLDMLLLSKIENSSNNRHQYLL